MATDPVAAFGESLRAHGVTWERATAESFEATLVDAVTEPAVGVELPYDEVSLDGLVTLEPTPSRLVAAETGVTPAGAGIAEYGTLLVQSDRAGTEPVSLYPPRHVAVVRASDVLPDVARAVEWLDGEFAAGRDSVVFATGPSATGDMGAIVEGVHGPREVHVVVLEL